MPDNRFVNLIEVLTLALAEAQTGGKPVYVSQPHIDGGFYSNPIQYADDPYLVVRPDGSVEIGCDTCDQRRQSLCSQPLLPPLDIR